MSITAMKQAMAYIRKTAVFIPHEYDSEGLDTITALRTAIQEAEKQPTEPISKIIGFGPDYRPCEHETGNWLDQQGVCIEFADGSRDCVYVSQLHLNHSCF